MNRLKNSEQKKLKDAQKTNETLSLLKISHIPGIGEAVNTPGTKLLIVNANKLSLNQQVRPYIYASHLSVGKVV